MTHVIHAMGTVVSLRSGDGDPEAAVEVVTRVFQEFEARFSLYRPDSELSRIARGRLPLTDASAELREVYAAALAWRDATGGLFTPHRADGVIDLNGIVKARATQRAAEALRRMGHHSWSLAVGGDVLVSGTPREGGPWTVGIADPDDRGALLTAVAVGEPRRAVAASGSAERGEHIWSSTAGPRIVQATVVADDIETADVLATTIVAGGADQVDQLTEAWPIDALIIEESGALRATPGMRRMFAAPAILL